MDDATLLTELQEMGRCKIYFDFNKSTSSENLAIGAYLHAKCLCDRLGLDEDDWVYDANQFSLTVIVDKASDA